MKAATIAPKKIEPKPVARKQVAVREPNSNGASRSTKAGSNGVLIKTLTAFRNGNFSVRMPVDLSDLDGKVADTLNEILEMSERMHLEFDRISRSVGKDGKLSQ